MAPDRLTTASCRELEDFQLLDRQYLPQVLSTSLVLACYARRCWTELAELNTPDTAVHNVVYTAI